MDERIAKLWANALSAEMSRKIVWTELMSRMSKLPPPTRRELIQRWFFVRWYRTKERVVGAWLVLIGRADAERW